MVLLALAPQQSLGSLMVGITIQNIGIAASIAWVVTRPGTVVGATLNHRVIVAIGIMSYSIYLWQQVFLNPYWASPLATFPLNIILVGLVAWCSAVVVERPALALRRWLLERRSCAPAAGSVTALSKRQR